MGKKLYSIYGVFCACGRVRSCSGLFFSHRHLRNLIFTQSCKRAFIQIIFLLNFIILRLLGHIFLTGFRLVFGLMCGGGFVFFRFCDLFNNLNVFFHSGDLSFLNRYASGQYNQTDDYDQRTGKGIYLWAKSEEFSSEFDSLFDIEPTDEFKSSFLAYFEGDFSRHFTEDTKTDATTTNSFFMTFEEILKRSQLEIYFGDFVENEMSGEGSYRWLSGRVYTGRFEKGAVLKEEINNSESEEN